jgi:hypothetical protein
MKQAVRECVHRITVTTLLLLYKAGVFDAVFLITLQAPLELT